MRAKRRHMKINGLPVKDAKASIDLTIVPKDVKNASRKDQTDCVVAVACKRDLGCTEARVHMGRTYLRFNGHWTRYLTPLKLRSEIISFDRYGKFVPGEYKLLKMQPHRKLDYKRKRPTGPHKLKKRAYTFTANVRPVGIYA